MEHDARSVANELIRRALRQDLKVTPLQVNKLVYFCHAWMLGIYHRPLLKQPVEAWRYGPVVPEVYRSLRRYGRYPISSMIGFGDEEYGVAETNIIDQVWEKYSPFSGIQLSAMTHAKGTPWHQVWSKWGQSAVIPDPIIEKYYSEQMERARR